MSADADNMLADLAAFQTTLKFRCPEPDLRLVDRSPTSVTGPLEIALNRCAGDLAVLIKGGAAPGQLKTCIKSSLLSAEKPLDREERQYLAHYYRQLGNCVGVDMEPILNRWLYGYLLSTL